MMKPLDSQVLERYSDNALIRLERDIQDRLVLVKKTRDLYWSLRDAFKDSEANARLFEAQEEMEFLWECLEVLRKAMVERGL